MRFADLLTLAWGNLWRNRTRSLLTGSGIAIRVAALLTLLAYGTGLEKTADRQFSTLKLDRALRVTSHPIPGLTGAALSQPADSLRRHGDREPLTDSLVQQMADLAGVFAAYPEMQFPAKLKGNGRTLVVTAEEIPMSFHSMSADQPSHGRFFERSGAPAILISTSMAERLGYPSAEAVVGDTLDRVTASLNFHRLRRMAELFSGGLRTLPRGQRPYDVRGARMLDASRQPVSGLLRVLLPLEFGRSLSKVPYFSTADLLFRHSRTQDGYSAVRVQLDETADPTAVRRALHSMGVYATSFHEQYDRLESVFLILDLALGIVGSIALLVAVLGIANTVMMNVRERTRKIGIMMAVGGAARDLQRLFVVESAGLGVPTLPLFDLSSRRTRHLGRGGAREAAHWHRPGPPRGSDRTGRGTGNGVTKFFQSALRTQ
jgi:putative ABC transport system permease protein